jgi:ribosomal protein S18 acetylase RimI-like enzyme
VCAVLTEPPLIEYLPVDLKRDRDLVLDIHCRVLFDSSPPDERAAGYLKYREMWLATPQPSMHLEAMTQSLEDPRTIADVVQLNGASAGLCWVTFHDVGGYGFTYAELVEIGFKPEFQRQGLGRMALARIEELVAERGAISLRSTGVARSESVRGFHEASGFLPYQTVFEKPVGGRSPQM